MATPEPTRHSIQNTYEYIFNDPTLTESANAAVSQMLNVLLSDYSFERKKEAPDAIEKDVKEVVEALFALPPFDSQPSWVASIDQLPFQRGDNLLCLAYRVSSQKELHQESQHDHTQSKIQALTRSLLDRKVLAEPENQGENSPLMVYQNAFNKPNETFDFSVLEMLTASQS